MIGISVNPRRDCVNPRRDCVNPRRDCVSARYGQFAPTSITKSSGKRSSKTTSSFRRPNSSFRHESYNDDFMSKLKDSTSSRNVYIPSNGVESVNINNYVENLLM